MKQFKLNSRLMLIKVQEKIVNETASVSYIF